MSLSILGILSVKCSYYQNSQTAVAAITKYYRLGGLNNRNLLLIVLETGTSKSIKVGLLLRPVSWLLVCLCSQDAVCTLGRETEISHLLLIKPRILERYDPTLLTLFSLNFLLKVLSQYTVTGGLRTQHISWRGAGAVHSSFLSIH